MTDHNKSGYWGWEETALVTICLVSLAIAFLLVYFF